MQCSNNGRGHNAPTITPGVGPSSLPQCFKNVLPSRPQPPHSTPTSSPAGPADQTVCVRTCVQYKPLSLQSLLYRTQHLHKPSHVASHVASAVLTGYPHSLPAQCMVHTRPCTKNAANTCSIQVQDTATTHRVGAQHRCTANDAQQQGASAIRSSTQSKIHSARSRKAPTVA